MINQFHYHIKSSVVRSRREDLYHIGVAHGGSNARLLLQLRGVVSLAAKIPAQQLQRHKPIQERIACLVNRAHPTDPERFDHNEMIKRPFHLYLFAACRTGDLRQRLRIARFNSRTAGRACLYHRELPLIAVKADCNIQRFRDNEMATRSYPFL